MRPFAARCVWCGDVDYHLKFKHCRDCRTKHKVALWWGATIAETLHFCQGAGRTFDEMFGAGAWAEMYIRIFQPKVQEEILAALSEDICLEIDRQVMAEMNKSIEKAVEFFTRT